MKKRTDSLFYFAPCFAFHVRLTSSRFDISGRFASSDIPPLVYVLRVFSTFDHIGCWPQAIQVGVGAVAAREQELDVSSCAARASFQQDHKRTKSVCESKVGDIAEGVDHGSLRTMWQ